MQAIQRKGNRVANIEAKETYVDVTPELHRIPRSLGKRPYTPIS